MPAKESDLHTRLGRKLRALFEATLADEAEHSRLEVTQSDLMRRAIEQGLVVINAAKPKARVKQIEADAERRAAGANGVAAK